MFEKKDLNLLAKAYDQILNEGKGHEEYNLRVNLPAVKKMLFDYGYKYYTTGGGTSKHFNNDRSMCIEIYKHPDSYRQNAYATIVRCSEDEQPIAFDGVIVDPKGAESLSKELGKGSAARVGTLVSARPWKTVEDIKALGYNVINPDTPEELITAISKDARQAQNRGRGPI